MFLASGRNETFLFRCACGSHGHMYACTVRRICFGGHEFDWCIVNVVFLMARLAGK